MLTFTRYKLDSQFEEDNAILTVAISPSGCTLASGGVGGLRLWDIVDLGAISMVPIKQSTQPISCTHWLDQMDQVDETLVFGTLLGQIVLWRKKSDNSRYEELYSKHLASGVELACLASKKTSTHSFRLAAGTRDGSVQVFMVSEQESPRLLFSIKLRNTVPKDLSFASGKRHDIHVFGLFDGKVHALKGSDGTLISATELGTMIGSAAVDHERKEFVIDNVDKGFSLHRFGCSEIIRNYETVKPARKFAKQVAFAEYGKAVVGGGENGTVYVFDRESGAILARLNHSKCGMVQTIATQDRRDTTMIISASSDTCGKSTICVWRRKKRSRGDRGWSMGRLARIMVKAFFLILSVAYLAEKYGELKWANQWQEVLRIASHPTEPTQPWWYAHIASPIADKGRDEIFEEIRLIREAMDRTSGNTRSRDNGKKKDVEVAGGRIPSRKVITLA